MKIGNGSIGEFILAIFFLLVGFNISDIITSIIVIIISIVVMIHCIYTWIKIRKENNNKN